jgi:transposase-like protein
MALSRSALSELLEAFRAGDGVDLIRESVRVALQELIEAEATERIGAAPYERTELPYVYLDATNVNVRNTTTSPGGVHGGRRRYWDRC